MDELDIRGALHWMMFWRWRRRLECHLSLGCCQYVDNANCNNPGVPWEHRNSK